MFRPNFLTRIQTRPYMNPEPTLLWRPGPPGPQPRFKLNVMTSDEIDQRFGDVSEAFKNIQMEFDIQQNENPISRIQIKA